MRKQSAKKLSGGGWCLGAAAPLSGIAGLAALDSLRLALNVVTVMFHVLGERLELGLLEQFAKRAVPIPTGGEE
jgi:hypothetical protein